MNETEKEEAVFDVSNLLIFLSLLRSLDDGNKKKKEKEEKTLSLPLSLLALPLLDSPRSMTLTASPRA